MSGPVKKDDEKEESADKHIIRVAKNAVKAERDLRVLQLFDVTTISKKRKIKKSRNKSSTSAINQVLLKERDCFEECERLTEKYEQTLDDYTKAGETDARQLIFIMSNISKNAAMKTKHLENMTKNITEQNREINKGSVSMQGTLLTLAAAQQQLAQHKEKLQLQWALVEKKTGQSQDELLEELRLIGGEE